MIIELPCPRRSTGVPKPSTVARARTPALTVACWGYLFVIAALWLALREAGDRWWPATVLLLAPRWPLAVPLLVLWPWTLRARRWWLVGVTGASTVCVGVPVMGLRLSAPTSEGTRADLRLLTCNIHRQHLDVDALAEFIGTSRPDVVAIQGWSETGHGALFADDGLGGWDIRRMDELLVASRFPIAGVTALNFPDEGEGPRVERGAAAVFELRTSHGTVHLLNLHLASPHAGVAAVLGDGGKGLASNIERRRRESEAVRGAADGLRGLVLLAGDFNTTDDSSIFRESWADYADAFDQRGLGFGYTYRIRRTQVRIDHILVAPPMRVARCWVGPDVGSPHRPLVADVNCR